MLCLIFFSKTKELIQIILEIFLVSIKSKCQLLIGKNFDSNIQDRKKIMLHPPSTLIQTLNERLEVSIKHF